MFGLTSTWQIKLAEYLIVIAIVFGAFYYVYEKGYSACETADEIKQAKADKAQQEKYNLIATKLENTKAERIVQTNTITKIVPQIVERTVYQTTCIDSQGMGVANKALKGEAYELPK